MGGKLRLKNEKERKAAVRAAIENKKQKEQQKLEKQKQRELKRLNEEDQLQSDNPDADQQPQLTQDHDEDVQIARTLDQFDMKDSNELQNNEQDDSQGQNTHQNAPSEQSISPEKYSSEKQDVVNLNNIDLEASNLEVNYRDRQQTSEFQQPRYETQKNMFSQKNLVQMDDEHPDDQLLTDKSSQSGGKQQWSQTNTKPPLKQIDPQQTTQKTYNDRMNTQRDSEINQFTIGTARETENLMVPSMDNIIDDGQGKFDQDLILKRKAQNQLISKQQEQAKPQVNGKQSDIRNEIQQIKSIDRISEFDQSMKKKQVVFPHDEPYKSTADETKSSSKFNRNFLKLKQRRQSEIKAEKLVQQKKTIQIIEKQIRRHNLEGSEGEDEELECQVKEIKLLEHKMRQDLKKKFGILPRELESFDFKHSLAQNNEDCCFSVPEKQSNTQRKRKKEINWQDFVVISKKSKLYIFWKIGFVLSCLISSYQFTWFAVFGHATPGTFSYRLMMFFEVYFIFSIVFNFFLEYEVQGQTQPVRDLMKIITSYLRGWFIIDLIPCIPLQLIDMGGDEIDFYLIKNMRLYIGMSFLNVQAIMRFVNYYNCEVRLANLIKNDPVKAMNIEVEQTMMTTILVGGYIIKVVKLIFIIFTVTYYLAMIWYIICTKFWKMNIEFNETADPEIFNTETFITNNNLQPDYAETTETYKVSALMYYAYTTLSTVGFGDFNPRSDHERAICIVVLLLGVAIFGIIMGQFLQIINKFKEYDSELDEGDALSQFFGLLKNFNYKVDIDITFKREIEQYFQHRWQADKCQAIVGSGEVMLEQLPEDVQNCLFTEFLYKSFLEDFKYIFKFEKRKEDVLPDDWKRGARYYTWNDQIYRGFMFNLLQRLEPRFVDRNNVIYHELEEIQEIFFQEKGIIDIGYEINRQQRFVLRLNKGTVVGAYNCCYEKRNLFIYKCKTSVHGYILRKQSWSDLIEDYNEIADILKKNVHTEYSKIKWKIQAERKNYISKLSIRAGQSQILSILNWRRQNRKQEKIDYLNKILKDVRKEDSDRIHDTDQIKEIANTFQDIANDDKSDESNLENDDSNVDKEQIEESFQNMTKQIKTYEKQIPLLYNHLDKVMDLNVNLTRELEDIEDQLNQQKLMNKKAEHELKVLMLLQSTSQMDQPKNPCFSQEIL